METKIRNPKTNRLISINGTTYKNLIKLDNYRKEDLQKLILNPSLKIQP